MRSRNRGKCELLQKNPNCVYCGGLSPATTIDHMPPIGMFTDRQRPRGFEFPCCENCNRNSRKHDNVAALLAALQLSPASERDIRYFDKLLAGIRNNQPLLFAELKPTISQIRAASKVLDACGQPCGAFDVRGPLVSGSMHRFGAKCALALHWAKSGKILTPAAQVGVLWYTNHNAIEGTVPQHLFELLPPGDTFQQGKRSAEDRFVYSSKQTDDGNSTAHWVTFGSAFMYYLFAGENLSGMAALPQSHVFQPGILRI